MSPTRRSPATPIGIVHVVIEGHALPGRRCGPGAGGAWCENVHVGLGRGDETVELVPGDAPDARWSFDLEIRRDDDGNLDFAGPEVAGPRDERHLYLRWLGELAGGRPRMFGAIKLRLFELEGALVEAALAPGTHLVGRIALAELPGRPRYATVRAPHLTWAVE